MRAKQRVKSGAGLSRVFACERCVQIDVSADTVWQWMADVRRLLSLKPFHAAVEYAEPVMQAGLQIPVRHNVCGLYRRMRMARIRVYKKYCIAWGEFQAEGIDRFPHSQSFTIVPVDAQRCMVINRLRGKFRLPAAQFWFLPLYRRIVSHILDYENQKIAMAVAAPVAVSRLGLRLGRENQSGQTDACCQSSAGAMRGDG